MHRYIPVIAKWAGYSKIGEKVVHHQARKFGKTKFGGIERFMRGPLDLMSIIFISKFGKRPMHFFGTTGTLISFTGFIILAYLAYLKIFQNVPKISDRPLFYLGIVCLLIGTQFFLSGFIAELVSRNNPQRNSYVIDQLL
jgi:hypothetical protein